MLTLKERAVVGSLRYLKMKGYSIIDKDVDDEIDIVALDDDDLVFIKVQMFEDGLPEIDDPSVKQRNQMERASCSYVLEHAENLPGDSVVRFDLVEVGIIADDRAMVRHTINWLS